MAEPEVLLTEEGAVTQVLTEYYRAFSTLELDAILPYFHEPALAVGPQGVFAASTRAELTIVFAPSIDNLRARGYGRSELRLQTLRILSPTAALATGVALRFKTDGHPLDQAGVTYLLHKSDAGWKIAVFVIHQPQN